MKEVWYVVKYAISFAILGGCAGAFWGLMEVLREWTMGE